MSEYKLANAGFAVGDRVVLSHGVPRRFARIDTVFKVYKNGNFVLSGGKEQYNGLSGQQTGSSSRWCGFVKHLSPALEAEVNRQIGEAALRSELRYLDKMSFLELSDEQVKLLTETIRGIRLEKQEGPK